VSGRILVTGGAGFIGSHLVERFTEADRVDVIDDLSRGSRAWLPTGTGLHVIDVRDADAVERVVGSVLPDVVVHLAARHFIPEVDGAPQLAWDVNVAGTKNLLQALAKEPPELLLFASTGAVYPNQDGPIGESCPVGPIDLYGRTKVEGERLVTRFGIETGTRCLVARIFNVIGRRETNRHVVPELIGQIRQGTSPVRLGNLSPRRDYTDVTDVADALAALVSQSRQADTTFNVGSGIGVSVAELVTTCELILARRIPVQLDAERQRSDDRAELISDVSRLTRATGWSPARTLEQTLSDLLSTN
jgi:UDP-glucose 4-epimerase